MKEQAKKLLGTVGWVLFCVLVVLATVCAVRYHQLRTGLRYHPPVVYDLVRGTMFYLDVCQINEDRPWELDNSYSTNGRTFQMPQTEYEVRNATFFWRNLSTSYGGTILTSRRYLILDLYDLEDIQAYPVEEGSFTIRDYDLEIDALGGGYVVYVQG